MMGVLDLIPQIPFLSQDKKRGQNKLKATLASLKKQYLTAYRSREVDIIDI